MLDRFLDTPFAILINSIISWFIDMLYHSVIYIFILLAVFMVPNYIASVYERTTFHFYRSISEFGLITLREQVLFPKSPESQILLILVVLSFLLFVISIFILIRTLPLIRLIVAGVGRGLYAEKRMGYGKDDTGRYNDNLKGQKVDFIRRHLYSLLVIGPDRRSLAHIPQEPNAGSPYPKSGYNKNYAIYNEELIMFEPGTTHYMEADTGHYMIASAASIIFYLMIEIWVGHFRDPRHFLNICSIIMLCIISIMITHSLMITDVNERRIVNGKKVLHGRNDE